MHACMYVYIYICMYVCVCMYCTIYETYVCASVPCILNMVSRLCVHDRGSLTCYGGTGLPLRGLRFTADKGGG